jgi:hypothetical protein
MTGGEMAFTPLKSKRLPAVKSKRPDQRRTARCEISRGLILTLALATASTLSAAPEAPWRLRLSVATITATHPDLETLFRFPWITGSSCGPTARCNIWQVTWRINTWLQATALNQLPVQDRTLFEKVWPAPGDSHGITSLDYAVLANTAAFVSLTLQGKHSGGYPTPFTWAYSFDSATGLPLTLEDLFSSEGRQALNQDVRRQWKPMLMAALANETTDFLNDDEKASRRDYYSQCLEAILNDESAADTMVLEAGRLTLTRDCPFPRVARALNDLGQLSVSYSGETLKPWLNDYGHCLFEHEPDSFCPLPQRTSPHPGAYRGRVHQGEMISLIIGMGPDADQAAYSISDNRSLRPLEGRLTTPLELIGPDGQGRFLLEPDHNGTLRGSWKNPRGVTRPVHFSN